MRHIRHRFAALVAMLVCAVFLSACGTPVESLESTPPSLPRGAEPSGKILFVADNDIMRWDGDIDQVTDDIDARSPTWSNSGERFAYVQMFEGFSEVVIANEDGETLRQLTSNEPNDEPYSEDFAFNAAWAFDPVWSPDGDELIFVSDKGGLDPYSDPLYMWYSEAWDSGIDPYPLDAAAGLDVLQENPSLSPDGERVAFVARLRVSDTLRNTEIWIMDLEGDTAGESETLVSHPDGAYDPAWSPDGEHIAYIQRDGTRNDVWIAPVDGGVPYRLTSIGTCVSPVWSPDGKFIAFFREQDGAFEAWYVELREGQQGELIASDPQKLFDADNIDTTSGMSWSDD